jgi:predicted ATPase
MYEPYHKALLAEAYLEAGEPLAGLEVLKEAMRFAEESGLSYWDAELLRLKGRLLACLPPNGCHEEEEECYQAALAVAQRQETRSLVLRAATSLARFWCNEGRCDAARRLLAPVYGSFTEGFNTPDLEDTRGLLKDLGELAITEEPE